MIHAKTELPLREITKSADVKDSTMFISIFDLLQNEVNFNINAVMANGIYDTTAILKYIINTIHVKPRISVNQQTHNKPPMKRKLNILKLATESAMPIWKCYPDVFFMIENKPGGVINVSAPCIIRKSININL